MRWKWNANTWESRPYCPTETKHSNYTHSNLKQKLLNWAWTQISNEITINSNYESIIFNSSVMYLLRFNLLGQLIPQWLKCPSNLIRKIQKVQRYAQMTHRIKFTPNQCSIHFRHPGMTTEKLLQHIHTPFPIINQQKEKQRGKTVILRFICWPVFWLNIHFCLVRMTSLLHIMLWIMFESRFMVLRVREFLGVFFFSQLVPNPPRKTQQNKPYASSDLPKA